MILSLLLFCSISTTLRPANEMSQKELQTEKTKKHLHCEPLLCCYIATMTHIKLHSRLQDIVTCLF